MIHFVQLPSSRKLLRTLLESTPDNLCYDEVHETLSKVIRQPSRAVCILDDWQSGARGCWGSLLTFVESFGSSGLSHCSPDHQGEIYICLIQILFKTWLFKPGEDLEGVRKRAAAVVRAKHKINKITIQVKIEKITIISCHAALSINFWYLSGGNSPAGCGSWVPRMPTIAVIKFYPLFCFVI